MKKLASLAFVILLIACGPPPQKKPTVPSLTPEQAAELLHYDARAQTWLVHVKKQNPACDYRLDLPDQTTHPAEIDLDHIVYCGNQPSSLELNASVVFTYDTDKKQWVLTRFSS